MKVRGIFANAQRSLWKPGFRFTIAALLAMASGGATRPAFIPDGYNDQANMQQQLGIKQMRPGKSGSGPQTGKGFDDALANDLMPTLPDVLRLKNGTKVTSKEQWPTRRAEILEDFEQEVYGRIPKVVPKITWEVSDPQRGEQGGIATITRTLTGHVDNSAFPQISVDLRASFTIPAEAPGPVPIIIEFGRLPGTGGPRRFGGAASRPFGAAGATTLVFPAGMPGETFVTRSKMVGGTGTLIQLVFRPIRAVTRCGRESSAFAIKVNRASPKIGVHCGPGNGVYQA